MKCVTITQKQNKKHFVTSTHSAVCLYVCGARAGGYINTKMDNITRRHTPAQNQKKTKTTRKPSKHKTTLYLCIQKDEPPFPWYSECCCTNKITSKTSSHPISVAFLCLYLLRWYLCCLSNFCWIVHIEKWNSDVCFYFLLLSYIKIKSIDVISALIMEKVDENKKSNQSVISKNRLNFIDI